MLILNFHRIEPPTGLEVTRVAPARYLRFLDLIEASGLKIPGPGTDPLSMGNQVILTFDDGFESISRYALPELQRRGWGAIVFLIAGFAGKSDDWDVRLLGRARSMMNLGQIKSWSDAGVDFGSHSMTHADLTALSTAAQDRELSESKAAIEQATGRPVRYLSYPFGRHNAAARHAAVVAGYEAAFATGGRLWDQNDRWAIPRVGINGLTSLFEFRTMLRLAANEGRGEGMDWRRRWHGRVFEALNAGSAAVGNWRRARRSRPRTTDSVSFTIDPLRITTNRNVTGAAGLR